MTVSHVGLSFVCVCVVGGHHLHQPQLGERFLSTAHVGTPNERAETSKYVTAILLCISSFSI